MFSSIEFRNVAIAAMLSTVLISCGESESTTKQKQEAEQNVASSYKVDMEKAKITKGDVEIVSRAAQGDFRRVRTMIENKTGAVNSMDLEEVTPLIAASNQGHIETVQLLLDYIEKSDAKILDVGDSKGKTALYYAVEFRRPEIVEMLRKHGANPNLYDNDGSFPIHKAVTQGDSEIVAELLEDYSGAIRTNPNVSNKNGQTPLMLAAAKGNRQLVSLLASNGADVNQQDYAGYTALMKAVENNDREMVGFLLQEKSNVNLLSETGLTALIIAMRENHIDLARHLLIKGADPSIYKSESNSPLRIGISYENADPVLIRALMGKMEQAGHDIPTDILIDSIRKGNYEVVKILVDSGADVTTTEGKNENALLRALEVEEPQIAMLMLEKGAQVNKLNKSGYSPLALAIKNDYLELGKALLSKGAEIEAKTQNPAAIPLNLIIANENAGFLNLILQKDKRIAPNKLLIQAVIDSKPKLVPIILANGGNPNVSDSLGKPVLWLSVAKNNIENVQTLLGAGAEINARDAQKGATSLMIAIAARNEPMVRFLLSAKADPNILDNEGLSALAYAILIDQPEIIKTLVAGGADINSKDEFGNTLNYVIENSQLNPVRKKSIYDLLKSLGFKG